MKKIKNKATRKELGVEDEPTTRLLVRVLDKSWAKEASMKCENFTYYLLWPPSPCGSMVSLPRFAGLRPKRGKSCKMQVCSDDRVQEPERLIDGPGMFSSLLSAWSWKTSLGLGDYTVPRPMSGTGNLGRHRTCDKADNTFSATGKQPLTKPRGSCWCWRYLSGGIGQGHPSSDCVYPLFRATVKTEENGSIWFRVSLGVRHKDNWEAVFGWPVLSHLSHVQPYEPQPARLLCPWDSPGKNTGVGCHVLLQGIFLTQESTEPALLTSPALAGGLLTTSTTWVTRDQPKNELPMDSVILRPRRPQNHIIIWTMGLSETLNQEEGSIYNTGLLYSQITWQMPTCWPLTLGSSLHLSQAQPSLLRAMDARSIDRALTHGEGSVDWILYFPSLSLSPLPFSPEVRHCPATCIPHTQ